MEDNTEWRPEDFGTYNLEKKSDRLEFIQKVYTILSVQLTMTALLVSVGAISGDYRDFMDDNLWLFLVSFGVSIITLILLFFVSSLHRKVPYNYILLFIFTASESFSISFVTSLYDPDTILLAAACTAAVTIGLTVYAFTTKSDFTVLGGVIIVISIGLMLFGLIFIFLNNDDVYRLIFCPFAVIAYGIFLVYDTQLIVGEKRHKIGYDDYILGSVALYIDIVGIFLYILNILGGKK